MCLEEQLALAACSAIALAASMQSMSRASSASCGRYELEVEAGGALHQDLVETAPAEVRDLGEIVLAPSAGVPLRVVDATGEPTLAWIEIAPYRPGEHTSELYPPNLHRHTEDDGSFLLPMPAAVSIVRATLMDPHTLHPSDDRSPDVLLDPKRPPLQPLELVLREPLPVSFEIRSEQGARIEVRDALELVVASAAVGGEEPASCELVPGRYRARLIDGSGAALGEREFELVDAPLSVQIP